MPASLEGQLVVAISSRALFDFEEENRHFEANDDRAYMQLQLERIDQAAKPGVAFSLVQKLLAFNDAATQRVEVVILAQRPGLGHARVPFARRMPIQRGVFTRGESPWRYLKPLAANLFLSANEADVRSASKFAVVDLQPQLPGHPERREGDRDAGGVAGAGSCGCGVRRVADRVSRGRSIRLGFRGGESELEDTRAGGSQRPDADPRVRIRARS